MANIGNLVAYLKADTKDFVRNLASSKRSVQSWGGTTRSMFKRSERGLGRLNRRMKDFDATGRLVRRTVLALGTAFGLWQLTKIAKGFHEVTVEAERTKAMLEGLYGSSEQGRAAFEWILRLDVPFGLDAIQDAFVKLRSVGIDPTSGSLEALLGGVAAFGGTNEVLKRSAIAIQQMAGKGVISMEELRQQLGEAIPTAMQTMADEMGMTVKEMVDVISKGNLDATTGLTALFEGLEKRYSGASQRMMKTWGGMTRKLAKEWTIFRIKVMETGPFQVLKQYFAELIDEIDRLKKTGKLDVWAADMADGILASIDLMLIGFDALGKAVSGFRAVFGILAEKYYERRLMSLNTYLTQQQKNLEVMIARASTPGRNEAIIQLQKEIDKLKDEKAQFEANLKAGQLMAEGNVAAYDKWGQKIDMARGKLADLRRDMEAGRGETPATVDLAVTPPDVKAPPKDWKKHWDDYWKSLEGATEMSKALASSTENLHEEFRTMSATMQRGVSAADTAATMRDWREKMKSEALASRESMYEDLEKKDQAYYDFRLAQLQTQYETYAKFAENEALADKWLVDQKRQLQEEWLNNTSIVYRSITDMSERTADAIEDNFSSFFKDVFKNELEDGQTYFQSFCDSLMDSFADMLGQMTKELLFGAGGSGGLLKSVISGVGGWFTGGGAGGGYNAADWASTMWHKGGKVGHDYAPKRMVPSTMFIGAPRLHNGLAADEFPAILQRGEEVLAKGQSRGVTINVPFTVEDPSGERIAGKIKSRIENMVVETMKEEMR